MSENSHHQMRSINKARKSYFDSNSYNALLGRVTLEHPLSVPSSVPNWQEHITTITILTVLEWFPYSLREHTFFSHTHILEVQWIFLFLDCWPTPSIEHDRKKKVVNQWEKKRNNRLFLKMAARITRKAFKSASRDCDMSNRHIPWGKDTPFKPENWVLCETHWWRMILKTNKNIA